jgi:hypothetical protein
MLINKILYLKIETTIIYNVVYVTNFLKIVTFCKIPITKLIDCPFKSLESGCIPFKMG